MAGVKSAMTSQGTETFAERARLLSDAPGEIVRRYRGESLAALGTRFADANLSNSG